MTDNNLNKELAEAVANQANLEHVETKVTHSEVALKLKCQECGEMQEFPVCDEISMEISKDGKTLTCSVEACNKTIDMPKHHDKFLVPFVVKA